MKSILSGSELRNGYVSILATAAVFSALFLSIASAQAAEQFATVQRLRGEVKATASGAERPLREGDKVFVGDKVSASGSSEAVLKTADSGIVAVRPGAAFIVQSYSALGDSTDNQALRLISGSLRLISGWIGRTNRAGHKVITPTVTIGIRGTDHEPFVLEGEKTTAKDGTMTRYQAGTYDKVNHGGTTLNVGDEKLDVDPGKVGYAPSGSKTQTRALMTLLLPVLLDKIPDFYVPGEFDAELDKYSAVADKEAQKDLEQKRKSPAAKPELAKVEAAKPASAPAAPATPAATPVAPTKPAAKPSVPAATEAPVAKPASPAQPIVGCKPQAIAKDWVYTLDGAILLKDTETILGQFAKDVKVKATVRSKDGRKTEVEFTRDDLVKSTLSTAAKLEGYRSRRVSTEGKLAPKETRASCQRLAVKTVVIEQGRLSGKQYRFESVESYILERRDGKWVATKAETVQR